MVHLSRRAAVASVRIAAVLVVGAAALPALRRRLEEVSVPTLREFADADSSRSAAKSTRATPHAGVSTLGGNNGTGDRPPIGEATPGQRLDSEEDHEGDHETVGEPDNLRAGERHEVSTAPARRRDQSRFARAWAFVRRGLTLTVWVLLALALGTGAYGVVRLPHTAVPKPQLPSIEIAFSPGHPALSPITVAVRLEEGDPLQEGHPGVTMAIDLTGNDFAHQGWSVSATTPVGVQVNGREGNDPRTGAVSTVRNVNSRGMSATVYIDPGPAPSGRYTAVLQWTDLTSGPLQVVGANMVAAFPEVAVVNQTSGSSSSGSSKPTPQVTVQHELDPPDDFTYLGGLPPDHFVGFEWMWQPETSNLGIAAYAFSVQARSATADEESHTAEFYSGIALGVAAAALIAGIQEFVSSGRRRKTRSNTTLLRGADAVDADNR
jgi:hypothetical protein